VKREQIMLFIPQLFATNTQYTGGKNVVAHVINEHFATIDNGSMRNLTHRHTGAHICDVRTDKAAERIVDRLMAIDEIDWSDCRVSYFRSTWQKCAHAVNEARGYSAPVMPCDARQERRKP
jgi:hypothetical protein